MLHHFYEVIRSRYEKLPMQEQINLLEQYIITIYGTEEKARERMLQLHDAASHNEDEFNILLGQELNGTFSKEICNTFRSKNLSGSIKDAGQLISTPGILISQISNPQMLMTLLEKQKDLTQLLFKGLYNIDAASREEMNAAMTEVYFTKSQIALEFNVDKKTLNKWLDIIFPDKRYSGSRKLNVLQYKEIFEKLFLAPNECKLDITENLQFYLKRIEYALKVSKGDLLEETASDYKTLSANAKKEIPEFSQLNVFPYSLAMSIMLKMGEEPIYIKKSK